MTLCPRHAAQQRRPSVFPAPGSGGLCREHAAEQQAVDRCEHHGSPGARRAAVVRNLTRDLPTADELELMTMTATERWAAENADRAVRVLRNADRILQRPDNTPTELRWAGVIRAEADRQMRMAELQSMTADLPTL